MNKCKRNVGAHDCAQRGITLIALVITIIVMLILVAVTITMAVNGGLFDYAKKAASETQNEINAEQGLVSGGVNVDGVWYNTIDEYINATDVNTITFTIDGVSYTAEEGMTWGEWINSSYNILAYSGTGNELVESIKGCLRGPNGYQVSTSNSIISGGSYVEDSWPE